MTELSERLSVLGEERPVPSGGCSGVTALFLATQVSD